ncbi:MAG: PQQ-binding-like beta-propeller repeat protein [Candidatus Aminicenantes bacterium]|nr:PQQ-binding-like beta-propeller repeat protein [Candidatus Aminicenantes bacterium]
MAGKEKIVNILILILVFLTNHIFSQSVKKTELAGKNLTISYGAVVRGPVDKKEIALIFSADTLREGREKILETLQKRNIRSSFFLTGNFLRTEEFKPLVERMMAEGHYVGPHSDSHLLYCSLQEREKTLVSKKEFISDLEKDYEALKAFGVNKKEAPYFLPPYEWYNEEIAGWAAEADLVLINPTPGIMTVADFTTPDMKNYLSSKDILHQVLEYEKNQPGGLNGCIMLIHLGTAAERKDKFYDRLNELLDQLITLGYRFVTLEEWLSPSGKAKPTVQETTKEKKNQAGGFSQKRREYRPEDFTTGGSQRQTKAEEFFELSLTLVWEVPVDGRVTALGTMGDMVFWITDNNKLSIIQPKDIKTLKQVFLEKSLSFSPGTDGRFIWLVEKNLVFGLDKSGQVALRIVTDHPLTHKPVSDGQHLFLPTEKSIEAFSLGDSQLLWKNELPSAPAGEVFFSQEVVFVPIGPSKLIAIEKNSGKTLYEYDFREPISTAFCLDRRNVFMGTDTGKIISFDGRKRRIRWQVKTGSQRLEYLLLRGKELYAFTSGGLMLKLNRKNGHLLKWQTIPGRIFSKPQFFQEALIVACSDRMLVGFDIKSSQKTSVTVLPFAFASGPCVWEDILVVSSYSSQDEKSLVQAYRQEPQVRLITSVKSPQAVGQRVVLTVQSAGFNQPKYEFFVKSPGGEERLVRRASRINSWTWLPVKPGKYELSVRVFDKKNNKKVSIDYNIVLKLEKKEEKEKANE